MKMEKSTSTVRGVIAAVGFTVPLLAGGALLFAAVLIGEFHGKADKT